MRLLHVSILFALIAFLFQSCSDCGTKHKCNDNLKEELNGHESLRLNQLGYLPNATKQLWVANTKATCFEIQDTAGNVVFNGNLEAKGLWNASMEDLKMGDFTAFTTPGSYVAWVADKGISYTFEITKDVYDNVFTDAIKTYYFQRASLELTEKYAGKWHRPLGQPDTAVFYHKTTGKTTGKLSSPKGWYDAGDLNKYIVNAGVTVGTLYQIYEMYPNLFPDNALNIPESGNGTSDFLDEIKYEMDWVLTMQDEDGGVFHKLSELDWQWAVMPHQWNDKERYVIGKSTASALNLAAMCAMTNRVFKAIDSDYATKNLEAAEKAWAWAVKHPAEYAGPDRYGVNSGAYDDNDMKDEFLWAAAELLVATGKDEYKAYLEEHYFAPKFEVCAWRTYMSNIGLFSLVTNNTSLDPEKIASIKSGFIAMADTFVDSIQTIPYQIPSEVFEWGSNSEFLNRVLLIGYAYNLTKDQKYFDAITRFMDYIFGTNALGTSFVTGYGENSVLHPHHRQCYADGIAEPIPGFIVGGPNYAREDDVEKHCPSCKTDYPLRHPATSYFDHFHSYASNEVTINWNASLIAVMGIIEANK